MCQMTGPLLLTASSNLQASSVKKVTRTSLVSRSKFMYFTDEEMKFITAAFVLIRRNK